MLKHVFNNILELHEVSSAPAENSLMHFESEDKTSREDFLLGRSLSQNRRKTERGASPTHYTLVPALQMEVSRSTSSSDSASLYHVSLLYLWKVKLFFIRISTGIFFMFSFFFLLLFKFHRCLNAPRCFQDQRKRAKVGYFFFFLSEILHVRSLVLKQPYEQVFHEECCLTPSSVLLPCWCLQLEVLSLQSANVGFPAGTWVRGTVRAGCGKRKTLKPIFRRSGRSTGSSWKTRVCTGTWMKRWIWSFP